MLGNPFYHSTTRNFVIAFGDLFNNIVVRRLDEDSKEQLRIVVPIEYAPKQKWWVMLKEDSSNWKRVRSILPRMSFEIVNIGYNPTKMLNPLQKYHKQTSSEFPEHKVTYNGIAYNLTVNLYIAVLNTDEGFQIVEQVLPFFTPNLTLSINTVPSVGIVDDVPISLQSVSKEDSFDGSFENLRYQTWTITFAANLRFYGPVTEAKPITTIKTDLHIVPGAGTITPDQTNVPRVMRSTTIPDPPNATATSDYGFSDTWQDFSDNKKYDPVTGNDVDLNQPEPVDP